MDFISVTYLVSLSILLILYYMIPKNRQWISLLVFSIIFYTLFSWKMWFFMLFTCITTFLYARYLKNSKCFLFVIILMNISILFLLKLISSDLLFVTSHNLNRFSVFVPVGISFYTLQSIAYMVDAHRNHIQAENNIFKYLLFMTFFPQVLQGPIPRYSDLKEELFREHSFSEEEVIKGFYLLLWGLFQKMVIADRCNLVVNHIFEQYTSYEGFFLILGGVLYSIQLYTDFAGCVCIAMGSAQMFGIHLKPNFNHPYFAVSIKDFWRRWHISLSAFLRDYVYIPLGGNRKGKLLKYMNIMITFLVSGIWHGVGLHYMVWGFLHGFYQVAGEIMQPVKDFLMKITKTEKGSFTHLFVSRCFTFFLVMIAWVFFRAESVQKAVYIVFHMFTKFNPWIFVSGELYSLGIKEEEWGLLLLSGIVMIVVALLHERKISIRDYFIKQPLFFRWAVLLCLIFLILITGVYGPGYDSAQFIYGGF
ncbi:MAG: MBOAT family protein [Lachnospiraceae bacterium]|nr:MBOAT family protein [Lachnospiraceae bacterium]